VGPLNFAAGPMYFNSGHYLH